MKKWMVAVPLILLFMSTDSFAKSTIQMRMIPAANVTQEALQIISRAKRGTSVNVEMYEFTDSQLAQALIDAENRGASVKVIMDASYRKDDVIQQMLQQAGIPVERMKVGSDGYTDIDHVKFLQVGNTLLVGSVNWGKWSDRTIDQDVELSGQTVSVEGRIFFSYDWWQARNGIYERNTRFPLGFGRYQLLVDGQIEPAILNAINEAKQSIVVHMFALDRKSLVSALISAKARGVTVQVVLDSHYQRFLNAKSYRMLKNAGINVTYEPYKVVMHEKMMNIDNGQILIMGSANWTNSGMEYNHELDVEIINS